MLMAWLPLFQAAALSHLVLATMLLVTDPRDRWRCHSHGAAGFSHLAESSATSHCQLVSADRQASVGFLICAFLARTCNPSSRSGVHAGVVLFLWNGALFFSGTGFGQIFGREAVGAVAAAAAAGPTDVPRVLLIGHTCLSVFGAAGYLLHYYMHLATSRVGDWVRGVGAQRRRPSGLRSSGQPIFVQVQAGEDEADELERGSPLVGASLPSFSGLQPQQALTPSAQPEASHGWAASGSYSVDKSA